MLKGNVSITAKAGVKLEIPDGAVIENKVKRPVLAGFFSLYSCPCISYYLNIDPAFACLFRLSMVLRISELTYLPEILVVLFNKLRGLLSSVTCGNLDWSAYFILLKKYVKCATLQSFLILVLVLQGDSTIFSGCGTRIVTKISRLLLPCQCERWIKWRMMIFSRSCDSPRRIKHVLFQTLYICRVCSLWSIAFWLRVVHVWPIKIKI